MLYIIQWQYGSIMCTFAYHLGNKRRGDKYTHNAPINIFNHKIPLKIQRNNVVHIAETNYPSFQTSYSFPSLELAREYKKQQ